MNNTVLEGYLRKLFGIKSDTAMTVVRNLNTKLVDDLSVAFNRCKNADNEDFEDCLYSKCKRAHMEFLVQAKKGLLLCDDKDDNCREEIEEEIKKIKHKLETDDILG